jgi:hypothetical protein
MFTELPALLFRRYRVFVSYRMREARKEAEQLKAALERHNITSFVSHLDSTSDDIAEDIVTALAGCELFVILATETFGAKTSVGFSTYNELEYACDRKKPLFLIKMFDGDFKEPMTHFRLPLSVPFLEWPPSTTVPADVIGGIAFKLGRP